MAWYKAKASGPRFNKKMLSYQYRKSHCGDKTVVRSSYLHDGISYTGKTTSFYWIRALFVIQYISRYVNITWFVVFSYCLTLSMHSRINWPWDNHRHNKTMYIFHDLYVWQDNSTKMSMVTTQLNMKFIWVSFQNHHCNIIQLAKFINWINGYFYIKFVWHDSIIYLQHFFIQNSSKLIWHS